MRAIARYSRTIARYIYAGVAWLNLVSVFVSIFLAGMALFVGRTYWTTHGEFGWGSELLLLALIAVGFLGWIPRRLAVWLMALIVIHFVQTILPTLKDDLPFISAAHPLNAMLLAWLSLVHAKKGNELLLGPEARLTALAVEPSVESQIEV